MPVWHETVKQLNSEKLVVLGVVQEQHAERTRLYQQWKNFGFQIVQDPITQLGLNVVPMAVGIDEHGIVREADFWHTELAKFVKQEYPAPAKAAPVINRKIDYEKLVKQDSSVENWVRLGDDKLLFPSAAQNSIEKAINAYQKALEQSPKNGPILFRLGVAHRMRYDSSNRLDEDFDLASKNWTLAQQASPNQYIWLRRIQQYGPRLEKPYPFYDWVDKAVADLSKRNNTPVELTVSLTQSERADFSESKYLSDGQRPEGTDKLNRDKGDRVAIESTVVPGFVKPGKPATIHLRMTPKTAKWNNEASPPTVWIESDSAQLTKSLIQYEHQPDSASSTEERQFEFDIRVAKGIKECTLRGFALYHVCLERGVCTYLRQDFEIAVPLNSD